MEIQFLEQQSYMNFSQKGSELINSLLENKNSPVEILFGNPKFIAYLLNVHQLSECYTHLRISISKHDYMCARKVHCLIKDIEKITFAGRKRFIYLALQKEDKQDEKSIHIIIPHFDIQTKCSYLPLSRAEKELLQILARAYNYHYGLPNKEEVFRKQSVINSNDALEKIAKYISEKIKLNRIVSDDDSLDDFLENYFINLDRNDQLIYEYSLLDYLDEQYFSYDHNEHSKIIEKYDEYDEYFDFDYVSYFDARDSNISTYLSEQNDSWFLKNHEIINTYNK